MISSVSDNTSTRLLRIGLAGRACLRPLNYVSDHMSTLLSASDVYRVIVGVGIDPEKDDILGFCAGSLIGYVVASIMMELFSSAVNAVIVCFAEAPGEFQRHHPALCREMVDAWRKAYPDECADDFTTHQV
jgi:hypothetical protein